MTFIIPLRMHSALVCIPLGVVNLLPTELPTALPNS